MKSMPFDFAKGSTLENEEPLWKSAGRFVEYQAMVALWGLLIATEDSDKLSWPRLTVSSWDALQERLGKCLPALPFDFRYDQHHSSAADERAAWDAAGRKYDYECIVFFWCVLEEPGAVSNSRDIPREWYRMQKHIEKGLSDEP